MNEAGDRREAGRRWDAAESQPISMTERALVARIYALFDCFYDQLSEEHEQMRRARMLRARRPDEQSRTAPTGNTLGSCVDNMIADQMDNLPEAVMLPEREETARSAEEMDDVVSFVLYRAGWPGKYQTLMEDAIVTGTGVAQVSGTRTWKTAKAWSTCWRGTRKTFTPIRCTRTCRMGGAASRRRAQAWPGWSSTIHRRKAM